MTSKVLSSELRELEQNKIILRKISDFNPHIIEYTSSKYCESMRGMITTMIDLGKNHRNQIKEI
ncbi:winged helix-turn-helix transcriptional regulator [Chryseobacterium soli]|uniref:winged helix-turn-helix transcriptional regulator n=1 Tax=Chryseobacterium soli TaxID=445961 RepID=UPI000A00489F